MGIMIAFELLTKLWSGKHNFSRLGEGAKEVKKFMKSVLNLGEREAGALIEFRNSLAHSYGLYLGKNQALSVDEDVKSASEAVEIIDLGGGKSKVYVNVWHLKKLFVQAVAKYRNRLESDLDWQKEFMVCLPNLGEINIQGSAKRI
jgi:hypothetical protein